MYDVHGKSVNGESKGRMQQAVEEWEKSAKNAAAPKKNYDGDDFDAEVKNLIKSNMNEINGAKSQEAEKQPEQPEPAPESNEAEQPYSPPLSQQESGKFKQADAPEALEAPENDADDENGDDSDAEDEPFEYESEDQAGEIIDDQKSLLFSLILKFAGCMACTVILVLIALAPAFHVGLPPVINLSSNPSYYILANLVLLLLAAVIGFSVALKGIVNLFTFRPDADSLTSLSVYAALIGGVYTFYRYAVSSVIPADLPATAVFTSCAAACLSFNLLGKIFLVSRVKNNLELISNPSIIKSGLYAAVALEPEKAHSVMRAFTGTPSVVTAQKVKFLTNFLEKSYVETPSDKAARLLSPIALVAALAAAACEIFLKKDASGAMIVFSAVCCASAPILFEVGVAVPFYRACKSLIKKQAFVAGCETLSEFGGTDAAVAEAGLVFPGKSTRVYGVKPFSGYKIEEVVLFAASIACAGESPLAGAFMDMFADSGSGKNMLKKAEKVVYEDEKGLSAVIDGKVVLLGNRGILRHHIIDAPSRDFELRYAVNGRDITYLAIDGVICAIFILGYGISDKTAAAFRRLRHYGVRVLIKSSDPNITPQLLEEKCGVPSGCITMLGAREMQVLKAEDEVGRCPAALAFRDIAGYAAALVSCIKLKGSLRANTILQGVFSVFGIVLVVYTAFFAGGAGSINPIYLLAYQAFCALPVLLISLLRRN